MRYWIVRHTRSDKILPNIGRGSTHWDPENEERMRKKQRRNAPPRLFRTEADANHFISWWEQGSWTTTYDLDGEHTGELNLHARPERRGMLESVAVELVLTDEK